LTTKPAVLGKLRNPPYSPDHRSFTTCTMAAPLVVVFTANSNTGNSAIDHLLKSYKGQVRIRGVVRKLDAQDEVQASLAEQGVEFIQGDITRPNILKPIFEGAHAAYFAVPTSKDRTKHGKAFVDACMAHGVQHAVIISMAGADTRKTLYLKQFAEIEQYAASKSGQPVTVAIADRGHKKFAPIIIRSPPFYQNFYAVLANMTHGTLYYPLEDKAITHVDLGDVGHAIAVVLANPEAHANQVYNIIGDTQPGNMIASNVSMKAGIQCAYTNVDDATCVEAFTAVGLQPWIAKGNVDMLAFIRGGNLDAVDKGDFTKLTGAKPRKFADFVSVDLKPLLV